MLDYLLKSGGCLLVLYLFYAVFLEKENMHVYKRIYLLLSVVISFLMPFVTFTNYVVAAEQIQPIIVENIVPMTPIVEEVEQVSYWPILLWCIYGLGVLLFGFKFIKNSISIIDKIKNNLKEKKGATTSVLLKENVVPHTFFSFIFFNKEQYVTNQIPKEVILHEETHARQKHSVDVLFLEVLQVLFWFNPIIYLLKKSVKLNHEFLADHAVLNHGTNTKLYQKTLLAYSSNTSQLPLANAINYSSIKKRLTVMKTHTSKKKIWLRSFILLPVLALLLFSFSTTIQQKKATPKQITEYNTLAKKYNKKSINNKEIKYVEIQRMTTLYNLMSTEQKSQAEKFPNIPPPPPPAPPKMPKNAHYVLDNKKVSYEEASRVQDNNIQSVDVVTKDENGKKLDKSVIYIYTKKETKKLDPSKRPITLVNGKAQCDGCVLELSKEKFAEIVLSVNKGEIKSFLVKFPKRPTLKVSKSTMLNDNAKTFLKETKIGQMVQIFNLKSSKSDLPSAPVLFKIIE